MLEDTDPMTSSHRISLLFGVNISQFEECINEQALVVRKDGGALCTVNRRANLF